MKQLRRSLAGVVLVAGGMIGGGASSVLLRGTGMSDAQAQVEPKMSAPGRYQVSSFSFGYGYSGDGRTNDQMKWGAYVLDTQTGDLYLAMDRAKPSLIGRVGEK
jgi:hypothetical protein